MGVRIMNRAYSWTPASNLIWLEEPQLRDATEVPHVAREQYQAMVNGGRCDQQIEVGDEATGSPQCDASAGRVGREKDQRALAFRLRIGSTDCSLYDLAVRDDADRQTLAA